MLKIEDLNFGYGAGEELVLRRVNAVFKPGELALLIGPTGSGKSTFLKIINRLVPEFSSGTASGSISLDGLDLSKMKTHDVAPLIGYVNQQPDSFFVSESVVEELAFGLEQLGIAPNEMKKRIHEICTTLGIEDLLERDLETLSAGQAQKVAIGAAMAAGQKILLLDEPSSALDDASCSALLNWLRDLTKQHGITVILCEHRFERVLPFTDNLMIFKGDGSVTKAQPYLASIVEVLPFWRDTQVLNNKIPHGPIALKASGVSVRYENEPAVLNQISIEIFSGEVIAIQGPNGSGKSTLLMALSKNLGLAQGTLEQTGTVAVVPQNASDLLFLGSVSAELFESDLLANAKANSTSNIFESLVGRVDPSIHPRDLSTGQQLALVLAFQLTRGAKILMLDEPTRGLDRSAKAGLVRQILSLSHQGTAVLLATHDNDFAEQVASRRLRLEQGVLIAESGKMS